MLLDDIALILQQQGIATLGADLFLTIMPDVPDNCISLYEYAGNVPLHAYGVQNERPGLQIKVRNKSYSAGKQKAQDIFNALDGIKNVTINGTQYNMIFANQNPTPLEKDASGRVIFVQNFRVCKGR